MKMILIGVLDRKAQTFTSLEVTPHIGVALRQLTEIVNKQSDAPMHKWPEDFSLWELGEWDSETGNPSPRLDDKGNYQRKLIVECESLKQN